MTDLPSVFVANGAAILLLFTLLLSSRRSIYHSPLDNKIFYIMVASTILQCVIETECLWMDGKDLPGIHIILLLLNGFLYINNIFFAFLWTIYVDYKLFGDVKRIKKWYPYMAIPAVLVSLGSIMNLFVPVYFRISEKNIYQRTGFFIIPYIITYLYLAYGVFLIYKYKNKVNKYLFLPALLFMMPILLGSVLQYLFYGMSLVWIGVAIALVSLYINVQNEVSYIDQLSGLFTRQYMMQYLESETRRVGVSKPLAGIMLDIDRFKQINDQYGHLVGDDAIWSVGKILHRAVSSDALAVRYAGDEFMVIQRVDSEKEVQERIIQIERETVKFNSQHKKDYEIHFSRGYAIYHPGEDTMDSFLRRMDEEMYKNKRAKMSGDLSRQESVEKRKICK